MGSAEVLDQYFTAEGAQADSPDFIINYVVGIACGPDPRQTTIVMDSVITGESSLDVFITLRRGETVQKSTKSARLFSIERREGYPVVQFYVNGKKDKALVLVGI